MITQAPRACSFNPEVSVLCKESSDQSVPVPAQASDQNASMDYFSDLAASCSSSDFANKFFEMLALECPSDLSDLSCGPVDAEKALEEIPEVLELSGGGRFGTVNMVRS